jgi:hypothetical protein
MLNNFFVKIYLHRWEFTLTPANMRKITDKNYAVGADINCDFSQIYNVALLECIQSTRETSVEQILI